MPKSRERVIKRRVRELQGWSLNELISYRDELGLKMDPTQSYDMPSLIAEEELRRVEHPEPVPGAFLEETEADKASHYNLDIGDLPLDALPGDGQIRPYDIRTSSGYFIYEVILPEVLRHFFSKNADYGDQHRTGLGIRAEFVGLHRKFAKLKAFFWDAKLMNHEDGKEMLYDVIGQCLIMLDLMAQEESENDGT